MRNLKFFIIIPLLLIINLPGILIGLISVSLILLITYIIKDKQLKHYCFRVLVSYDQTTNALTGGDEDETISSRTGKLRRKRKWARILTDFLNIFEKDHTKKSIEEDEGKNKTVE